MSFFRHLANHSNTHTLVTAGIMLSIALGLFGPSGQDDPYITFSTAQELAQHHHIANINGEAVESGSSILHVVLLAISHNITGIDFPILGIFYSLFFAIACLPLVKVVAKKAGIQQTSILQLALALSTGFIYWAMGSLESTFSSFLILCIILSLTHYIERESKTAGLMCCLAFVSFLLVRPEAFFVGIAALIFLACVFSTDKNKQKKILFITAAVVITFLITAICRYLYFGQLFPQPVYAKADQFHAIKILHGLLYFIVSAQISLIALSFGCLVALNTCRKNRQNTPNALWISLAFCLAYLAFIVSSGGDWMGGGRFFVPIIPALFIIFFFTIQHSTYYKQWIYALFIILTLELTVFSEQFATGMPIYKAPTFLPITAYQKNTPYHWTEFNNYIHANDIILLNAITPIIQVALTQQEQVNIAGVQMGMIPYFLRQSFQEQVYFIDMRGLTTQHITQCKNFVNAPRLWTGIFVDYAEYFNAQQECQLPSLDIIYELQNLNVADNQTRLQALEKQHYHIVYTQHTHIRGGFFGNKLLQSPYIIAVSDALFQRLPNALKAKEVTVNNEVEYHAQP